MFPKTIILLSKHKSHMKKYIPYILSAWLIIGFSFLTMETFSQANQKGNKMDTTRTATAKPDGTSPYVTGITTGRAKSLVGTVVGLISLVIGWRAKLRSNGGTGNGRTGAIVALVLGLIGSVLSVVHLSTSYGAAFGTGSGKAGALVALLLGLIGMTLGGLALRSRNKADFSQ
jgi:hypothetical protein